MQLTSQNIVRVLLPVDAELNSKSINVNVNGLRAPSKQRVAGRRSTCSPDKGNAVDAGLLDVALLNTALSKGACDSRVSLLVRSWHSLHGVSTSIAQCDAERQGERDEVQKIGERQHAGKQG